MSSARKREVLHGQARTMVAAVIQYFNQEKANKGPLISVDKVLKRASEACNISLRTVERISSEMHQSMKTMDCGNVEIDFANENVEVEEGLCTTPIQGETNNSQGHVTLSTPRRRKKMSKRRVTGLDDFDKSAVRRHVVGYYERKEVPTLRKLVSSLKDAGLFNGVPNSLRRILNELGFKYKRFNNRKVLLEKSSVALWRCRFLRKMQKVDLTNTVFLDETWVNESDSKKRGWTDDSVKGTLGTPIGKGKRLIICHAGSSSGWVKALPLVFESKKNGDYHEEMNSAVFENWFFNSLLPAIPPGSTIIMDNAPYHSRVKDKAPTSSSLKEEIKTWLKMRNIPFSDDLRRPELYQLVRLHKPPLPTYVIDSKASELGHEVIRLPPYHCHYNAIELAWSYLKGYVKYHNTTHKLKDVKKLFEEAVEKFTPDMWKKYVDHVKKVISEDWKNEGLDQRSVQQFLINLTPGDEESDSTSDSESDEDNLGCVSL